MEFICQVLESQNIGMYNLIESVLKSVYWNSNFINLIKIILIDHCSCEININPCTNTKTLQTLLNDVYCRIVFTIEILILSRVHIYTYCNMFSALNRDYYLLEEKKKK